MEISMEFGVIQMVFGEMLTMLMEIKIKLKEILTI